jgi:hypothetical protein
VNLAATRNNLRIAGADTAREPGGQAWTVRIIRPTDPRSRWIVYDSWYLPTLLWERAKRALRRDRRWSVEALPSPETNWECAVAVDEVQGRIRRSTAQSRRCKTSPPDGRRPDPGIHSCRSVRQLGLLDNANGFAHQALDAAHRIALRIREFILVDVQRGEGRAE